MHSRFSGDNVSEGAAFGNLARFISVVKQSDFWKLCFPMWVYPKAASVGATSVFTIEKS